MIPITINNRLTHVRPTATVLQACESVGVDVPRFCYHENLSVAGNCRRCLVEVEKSPKPVVSCARPVSKGRVIYTNTPLVRKAREAVLEFLLLNHPLDCPICDQGGECDLQDEALNYGSDRGRNYDFKRSVEDKECGPIVKTIRTRCIHCTRCIRFSTEVAGIELLGSFGRGEETEIGTYISSLLKTELSGNLVDLCPVGALTSKPYAYTARSWELTRVDTVDFFDALGSDITLFSRFGKKNGKTNNSDSLLRILPKANGLYTENWISDRTRYAFDGLKQNRLLTNQAFKASFEVRTNSRIVVGSTLNVERLYAITVYALQNGQRSPLLTSGRNYLPVSLSVDSPFGLSLNSSVSTFGSTIESLILIGTNLRYEASLLATRLRREESRRPIPVYSVGSYSSLRFGASSRDRDRHTGVSFRTLVSLLEGRFSLKNSKKQTLFLGVESLRHRYGAVLEGLSYRLAARFLTQTETENGFGVIHASTTSLAGAVLGRTEKTLSTSDSSSSWSFWSETQMVKTEAQKVKTSILTVQHLLPKSASRVSKDKKLNSLSTHKVQSKVDRERPITSLYERNGSLLTLDGNAGRLRKHHKGLTPAGRSRSLEALLSESLVFNVEDWLSWTEGLSRLGEELPTTLTERSYPCFPLNGFAILHSYRKTTSYSPYLAGCRPRGSEAALFHPTVRNFYQNDPISLQSPTRGSCALYLLSCSLRILIKFRFKYDYIKNQEDL